MIPTCCCSSRFSPIQNSYLNFLLVVSLSRSNWEIWTWGLTHLNKGTQKLWTGSTTPLEMKQCVQCSSCTRVCLYWNCESQSSVREHRCRVPHVFSVTNAASAANFASHVIECHSLAVPICLCAVLSLVNPVLEGGRCAGIWEKDMSRISTELYLYLNLFVCVACGMREPVNASPFWSRTLFDLCSL